MNSNRLPIRRRGQCSRFAMRWMVFADSPVAFASDRAPIYVTGFDMRLECRVTLVATIGAEPPLWPATRTSPGLRRPVCATFDALQEEPTSRIPQLNARALKETAAVDLGPARGTAHARPQTFRALQQHWQFPFGDRLLIFLRSLSFSLSSFSVRSTSQPCCFLDLMTPPPFPSELRLLPPGA